MIKQQRGISMIETMGAIAIGTMLLLGLTAMIDASLDDVEGQQAALYQAQVVSAARKYIAANYDALRVGTPTAASVVPISIEMLKTNNFLPAAFGLRNAYDQRTCVLVRQPLSGSGKLDALVVTSGGQQIEDRLVPSIAANAGQGSGYITAAQPATARGASWSLNTNEYRNVACPGGGGPALTGNATDGGHLASSLFYDGPGQLSTDFLYRNSIPGRPELNQMRTPVHLMPGTGAQAIEEDKTDPRCATVADNGKIAVDAAGRVLSCQTAPDGAHAWKRQGSGYWKDPVADFAQLPTNAALNNVGDVRMVTGLGRAFTWNGTAWVGLAVDEQGNLLVPGTMTANYVRLNQVVSKNTACTANGLLARDASGLVLSCQSGTWRSLLDTRITTRALDQQYTFTPDNGPIQTFQFGLAALPGTRPLYVTGYAHCYSAGNIRTFVAVELLDAANNIVGYAGGCGFRSESGTWGELSKGLIALQKIPENVTSIRTYVDVGTHPLNQGFLRLVVANSE